MPKKEKRRCTRCVLPDTFPQITFNEKGVCNFCLDAEIHPLRHPSREKELTAIFNDLKKKKKAYDCIVPISGGKDSTYVLYLIRKRFGLKALGLTLNNYYRSPQADDNLRRALEILDVDHLIVTPRWSLFRRLYKRFLEHEAGGRFVSEFCIACNIAIWTCVNRYSDLFGVPVIYGGVREIESSPPEIFGFSSDYFKDIAREVLTEEEVEEFAPYPMNYKNAAFTDERASIWIFDYLPWDRNEEQKVLKSLGWSKGKENIGEIHIDCTLHDLCSHFHFQKWGGARTALHYSKMIRRGDMKRPEAMRLLRREEAVDARPILSAFKKQLAND